MEETTSRWVRVVGSGLAYEGACLLHAIMTRSLATGKWIALHDGRDRVSGKPFGTLRPELAKTDTVVFSEPVPFDTGLYVEVEVATTATIVHFTPKPS